MALLAPLFLQLMAKCQNGVLPNLKLKMALVSAHNTKAIFHVKHDADDWCNKASNRIRMMAAKYREVFIDESIYARCMGKAWGLAHKEIDSAT